MVASKHTTPTHRILHRWDMGNSFDRDTKQHDPYLRKDEHTALPGKTIKKQSGFTYSEEQGQA
jgi:hypothetical protein